MPKLKTHKGVKKRVKLSKNGKIKRSKACRGHLMLGKSGNRRRKLRKGGFVEGIFAKRMKQALHE